MQRLETNEYQNLNSLLNRIAQGDRQANEEFVEAIGPWLERTNKRIAQRVLQLNASDENFKASALKEPFHDAAVDTLLVTLRYVKSEHSVNWSSFSQRYQTTVRKRFETEVNREKNHVSDISHHVSWESAKRITTEIHGDRIGDDPFLEAHLEKALSGLKPRERYALEETTKGASFEEIGEEFGVTGGRVKQIVSKAQRRMTHPMRAEKIKQWAEIPSESEVAEQQYGEKILRLRERAARYARKMSVRLENGDYLTGLPAVSFVLGIPEADIERIIDLRQPRITQGIAEALDRINFEAVEDKLDMPKKRETNANAFALMETVENLTYRVHEFVRQGGNLQERGRNSISR